METMPDLAHSRVLVTGGAGFIGMNLVQTLIQMGADVHCLIRPTTRMWRLQALKSQIQLHTVDLLDAAGLKQLVETLRPDYVVHLAVQGVNPVDRVPQEMLSVSLLGTYNLLAALVPHPPRRFLHIGSSTEYGKKPQPMTETDRLEPVSIHGVGKAAAALVAGHFAMAYQLPITELRLFTIYGPWESAHRLIPTAIRAALKQTEIALTSAGYAHDYVYVMDVVEACLKALRANTAPGESINIGSGQQYANEDVIKLIEDALGQAVPVRQGEFTPNLWDTPYWVANPAKATIMLNWQARPLSEGLISTVEWFKQNLHWYE
jgi:nucleoside-diphosphate-sugar epimerase